MSCLVTLNGIASDYCDVNLSGVEAFYLCDFADVEDVALDASNVYINDIEMASDKKFKEFRPAKNTGSLTKTLTISEETGVKYYTNEASGNFNKMADENRGELDKVAGAHLRGMVKDYNGNYWFLGKDRAVTASALTGQTGAGMDDGNFYTLTIQDISASLPYRVDASVAESVIG